MLSDRKRIVVKIRSEQFGCDKDYFDKNIKNKPLDVVKEYSSMIVVKDQLGETWNIFNGDFIVKTDL